MIVQIGVTQGFLVAHASGPDWELENIVVSENVRREGLASALIAELIHRIEAFGAEAVFLEVRESNQPARQLYSRFGFLETGCRKSYYSAPEENAILYTLRLG